MRSSGAAGRKRARMISTLAAIARGLFRTPESIATPCSVKAYGAYRLPPRPFEITICDLKDSASTGLRRNMKSPGHRSGFRFTDCTRTRVSTPYSAASSVSRRTLRPRRTTMDLAIRSAGISVGQCASPRAPVPAASSTSNRNREPMRCTACRHDNPDGARFCEQCGVPVTAGCTRCRTPSHPRRSRT